jgi:hypothetical protein
MVDQSHENQASERKAEDEARERAEFERQIKLARRVMDKYRNVLRELAKR